MPDSYKSESEEIAGLGRLKLLTSEEVFSPSVPPLVVVSQSGGGKTVTAVDQVYTCAESLTGLIYFTNSYYDPSKNAHLRSMIPHIHVKDYDVQMIANLWGDILQRSRAVGSHLGKEAIERFIQERCASSLTYRTWSSDMKKVFDDNMRLFTSEPDAQAAMSAHMGIMKIRYIAANFNPFDQALTASERLLVTYCQSSTPCPNLVFDDVTVNLNSPPREPIKVPSLRETGDMDWKSMPGPQALEYLIGSITTTMRGNGVAGFYMHSFPPSARLRQQFGAIMMCDSASIQEMVRQKTVPSGDKVAIEAAFRIANQYPFHRVIYFPNPDVTPHGQRVALFKPTYHREPKPIGCPTYKAVVENVTRALRDHGNNEGSREERGAANANDIVEQLASGHMPTAAPSNPYASRSSNPYSSGGQKAGSLASLLS